MGKFKGISNSTLRATARLFLAMNIPVVSKRMAAAIVKELYRREVEVCDHLLAAARDAYEADKRKIAAAIDAAMEQPRVNSRTRGAA